MIYIAKKKLWSVFTDDMDTCFFTGCNQVERHHIFAGCRKSACEKYGYIVPLRPDFHPNGVRVNQKLVRKEKIDERLKKMAQRDFEEKHGTREDFREIFGKSYL